MEGDSEGLGAGGRESGTHSSSPILTITLSFPPLIPSFLPPPAPELRCVVLIIHVHVL